MKRLVFLFIGIFVLGLGVLAQNVGLNENLVVPPKYDASSITAANENNFNDYFNKQMVDYELLDEGLVIMKFTIHPNGDVSNCVVEHSTSRYNTVAVRNILESSSGRWQPGKVNGEPVDMEKEITVKFVDPNHVSLEARARGFMSVAVKKYYKAEGLEGTTLMAKDKADRKIDRRLKGSIRNLNIAYEFAPRDIGVLFWQSKVYEAIGDEENFKTKFNELQMYQNPSYESMIENIVYELRN